MYDYTDYKVKRKITIVYRKLAFLIIFTMIYRT